MAKIVLPSLPGHSWRPMETTDALALVAFEREAAHVDGSTRVRTAAEWQHRLTDERYTRAHGIVAVTPRGDVAAVGWIWYQDEHHEVQAFLDGGVRPQHRGHGLGRALLAWLEERAERSLNGRARRRQRVLRILRHDSAPDALALYARFGYTHQYTEEELRFDLAAPIPDHELPCDMLLEPWSPDRAGAFYELYRDAFSTRTTNLMSQESWQTHFANAVEEDFRPELSWLLYADGTPVAFVVCHVEQATGADESAAWITQLGVHPAWRKRGIGSLLLAATLGSIKAAGFRKAKISVNVDNQEAQQLYERIGFKLDNYFTVFRKDLDTKHTR